MMIVPAWLATFVLCSAIQSQGARELASPAAGPDEPSLNSSPVRRALEHGGYPWYDSDADRLRGVWTPTWRKRLNDFFVAMRRRLDRLFEGSGGGEDSSGRPGLGGERLGTAVLATVLGAFFVFLIVLWMRREPSGASWRQRRAVAGTGHLLAQLDEELGAGIDDPWAEAQRRRNAGDLSGAVIYLFAHQLLSLHRVGLIDLAPGRTGRQYARRLRDPALAESLGSTLQLFEEIYYGHRRPSADAFERVWTRALALEARRDELEALQ